MSFPYIKLTLNNCLVALLVVGSAISLLSCVEHDGTSRSTPLEMMMSESSTNLTVVVSENGRPSYRFTSPLVEGYSFAREPYREFRRGVYIITYIDDSLSMVDATLRSNYGIYYTDQKLWEVKGDVVVVKHDGKELYTQQLFWNSQTRRIYSNVDTRIVDTNNGDSYVGEGFESDEEMKEWSFRRMKGRMLVDTSNNAASDSTLVESPQPRAESTQDVEREQPQGVESEAIPTAVESMSGVPGVPGVPSVPSAIPRAPEPSVAPAAPTAVPAAARERVVPEMPNKR